MLRATIASLLARKLRLALTAIAVSLGVAFVAGSLVFTDTLGRTFDTIMLGSTGDVVVRPVAVAGITPGDSPTPQVTATALERLRTVDGVARVDGNLFAADAFVVGSDGKLVASVGAPSIGINWTDAQSLAGDDFFRVTQGRPPSAHLEVVLDARTAERAGYALGETVHIVTRSGPIQATLVGIGEAGGSIAGATVAIFDTPTAQELFAGAANAFHDAWVTAADGVDPVQLAQRLTPLLPAGLEAVDGKTVAAELVTQVQEALSFITTFLLVFAGIALVVGSFLIVNTFTILVAQRTRELALLRALGARRRQVSRTVLIEALVVGVVGSTLGLFGGLGLARGIQALMSAIGLDLAGATLALSPRTVVAAYAVGVLVTLFAAWLPARRASAVPPVAAMADEPTQLAQSTTGLRGLLAGVLIVLGVAGMAIGTLADVGMPIAYVGVGMLAVLLGVAAASPVLGRPLLWALGGLYRRVYGPVGQLAAENAQRNPRRTAATASALMIGMALVTTMAILGSSTETSLRHLFAEEFAGDYQITSPLYVPFSPDVAQDVAAVAGVEAVSRIRTVPAAYEGTPLRLDAIDPQERPVTTPTIRTGSLADLRGETLMAEHEFATERGWQVGTQVALTGADGSTNPFRVVATVDQAPGLSATTVTTLDGARVLGTPESDSIVTVFRAPGADPADVQRGLDAAIADLPTVVVQSTDDFVDTQLSGIGQLLAIIYALLGLAVVIAVLGIVNTLALSVIERTREIGLLRAIGLRRRQLRRMVRLESIAIALLGAALGTGLGVAFGAALQRPLADDGIDMLDIPAVQLGAVLLVSVVVGVLAAIWPSRRAARMDVLTAIAAS